ncbi:hypothetical protein [Gorillibacterium sp. CAU 1737]|uniref:hypothetical protein n=1 Tax=Gorillibacterium sp. CAU 1737 TaxID=3140362 RepID=UPI003261422A
MSEFTNRERNERQAERIDSERMDSEDFLRGIYLKASLLDFDRREEERVQRNRRRLRRQSISKALILAVAGLTAYAVLRMSAMDLGTLLTVSIGVVALGTTLEQMSLGWRDEWEE